MTNEKKDIRFDSNTIVEPAVLGADNKLNLFGITGIVNNGQKHLFPYIGGVVDYDGDSKFVVTAFRYMMMQNEAFNSRLGEWYMQHFYPALKELQDAIAAVLIDTTKDKKNIVVIENELVLRRILATVGWQSIIKRCYETFPNVRDVCVESHSIPWFGGGLLNNTGVLDLGLPGEESKKQSVIYHFEEPWDTQKVISAVRSNQTVYTAVENAFGIKQKATPLIWLLLHSKYGPMPDMNFDLILQHLDRISWAPMLSYPKNHAAYLARQLFRIGIYSLTSKALRPENWMQEIACHFTAIPSPGDALKKLFAPYLESWQRGHFRVVRGGMEGRLTFKVLPFTSDKASTWKFENKTQIAMRLDDIYNAAMNPEAVKKKELISSLVAVAPVQVNCVEHDVSLMWDRAMGILQGDLSHQSAVPHIGSVVPRYLGRIRPDTNYSQYPRDQWPLVFIYYNNIFTMTVEDLSVQGGDVFKWFVGPNSAIAGPGWAFDYKSIIDEEKLKVGYGKGQQLEKMELVRSMMNAVS
jgi:hypothetical protein